MSVRSITGFVVADKNDKTIVVSVIQRRRHPLYDKAYLVTRRFAAHDEANEARIGDRVRISETRPISKSKTWRLSKVIERAEGAKS
jgi:small subunit ribosomal protein S17